MKSKKNNVILTTGICFVGMIAAALVAPYNGTPNIITPIVHSAIAVLPALFALAIAGGLDTIALTKEKVSQAATYALPLSRKLIISGVVALILLFVLSSTDAIRAIIALPTCLIRNIGVAIPEEIIFRGLVLTSLVRFCNDRDISTKTAVLMEVSLFTLLHINPSYLANPMSLIYGIAQIATVFAFGWTASIMRLQTNSLLPGIVVHFMSNVAVMGFTGAYAVDMATAAPNAIIVAAILLVNIAQTIIFVKWSRRELVPVAASV